MNDLDRLACAARDAALDRIRRGAAEDVAFHAEDLAFIIEFLETRAPRNAWTRARLAVSRARMRGLSAALRLELEEKNDERP